MNLEQYQQEYPQHQDMRERVKQDANRLHFHLMPPTGWLNDPNGLCQFQGQYHIYFQYTPFLAGWGTKLWGHYTSTDLIHFQEHPPFLFPDTPWDRDGVYSGSALVHQGNIHYFYTGNVKLTDQKYDYIMQGREQNTIHLVSQDGFHTHVKELVLTNQDYPKSFSKHVRDPKIYTYGGQFYMVLGARDGNSQGCALVYRSTDLSRWEYMDTLRTQEPFGYMWECPDLFDVDQQTVLMACPQGISQQGHHYQNVYQCGYFPVQHKDGTFVLGDFQELDYGFDIYAPQTFEDEQGRRILLAWMGIPDAEYSHSPTAAFDWIHALTMPRQLVWKDGHLYQQPLEEMRQLRTDARICDSEGFGTWYPNDCCYELTWKSHGESFGTFHVQLRDGVDLTYQDGVLTLQMSPQCGAGRTVRSLDCGHLWDCTVFSDTSSLELFINGGRYTMTTRVYSPNLLQPVRFLEWDQPTEIHAYTLGGYHMDYLE